MKWPKWHPFWMHSFNDNFLGILGVSVPHKTSWRSEAKKLNVHFCDVTNEFRALISHLLRSSSFHVKPAVDVIWFSQTLSSKSASLLHSLVFPDSLVNKVNCQIPSLARCQKVTIVKVVLIMKSFWILVEKADLELSSEVLAWAWASLLWSPINAI